MGNPPTMAEVGLPPQYYQGGGRESLNRQNPLAQSMQILPKASERRRDQQDRGGGGGGLELKEDPSRKTVSRMKNSYGDELRRQMEEDKRRKNKSREKDKDEDIYFLKEAYNYQPFGRGGGGAPLRDQFGNMITSFKPFMRGDHERTHFREFIKRSGSQSSRGSSRSKNRHDRRHNQGHSKQQTMHHQHDDDDDFYEPDTIAKGPISNTTAATAAAVANNAFFRPDYIVDYKPEK